MIHIENIDKTGVFEDGNYIELLQSGESLDEIKFDEQGNMYYLVKDYQVYV